MPRMLSFYLLLVLVAPAAAQEVPLAQVLIDGQEWHLAGKGFASIQGLAADKSGNVYVADGRRQRIDRLDPQGRTTTVWQADAPIAGLAFGPHGRLYVCEPDKHAVVVLDANYKAISTIMGVAAQALAVTAEGTIYATVPEEGVVYRIGSDHQKTKVAENLGKPFGLTLWPDQGTLVVGDRAGRHLWAFRIEPDGRLTAGERYYALQVRSQERASEAAGVTVDVTGRVYATSRAGLQVFDTSGRLNGILLKPGKGRLAAVTFGGPGGDTLYLASSHQVYARKVRPRGVTVPAGS